MAWPGFQNNYANRYSPPPFAPIESQCPRQQSMPAIFGDPESTNYMGLSMHHGLPNNGWAPEPSIHIPGQAMLCNNHVSPLTTSFGSSSSSSASDAMASMSLDTSIGSHRLAPADTVSCPSTISPKALRINPSPVPTSSFNSASALIPSVDGTLSSASSYEQQYLAPQGIIHQGSHRQG